MAVNIASSATVITRVVLYRGQPTTSDATLYTVPASTNVKMQSVVMCNTTGSPATVTLSVVQSGGTSGAANRILAGFSIAANDTEVMDVPIDLAAGDFISGLQGTGSAITLTISGETYL